MFSANLFALDNNLVRIFWKCASDRDNFASVAALCARAGGRASTSDECELVPQMGGWAAFWFRGLCRKIEREADRLGRVIHPSEVKSYFLSSPR